MCERKRGGRHARSTSNRLSWSLQASSIEASQYSVVRIYFREFNVVEMIEVPTSVSGSSRALSIAHAATSP